MAFKTAAEMFGDGGGFGPAVPYSILNPPGTFAGNRGIQFGEQLTASNANRTHYALALNDENLNTRLVAWETGGLDAAYDLGALAVPGGGREIGLTGGAVETVSAHLTQYAQDISNAHFRANASSDSARGGGGFDFDGYSQSGLASAAYGFLDRRSAVLASVRTSIPDLVVSTLNPGGGSPDVVSIAVGQFKDGGNLTDLALKYDMLEVEGPLFAGLYIIRSLPTTTTAVLRRLDGSIPAFAANTPTTVRFHRPTFGTFSPFGSTSDLRGVTIMGMPGQTMALNIVPGTFSGSRDALAGETGAPYALAVRAKTTTGGVFDTLVIESTGQITGVTSIALLSAADQTAGVNFGVPTVASIRPGSSRYESDFVARNSGTQPAHFGFMNAEAMSGATFADPINFTFAAPIGTMTLTGADGLAAADDYINPGAVDLIEILTPALNAGIYAISTRAIGTGVITVTDLGGVATALPIVGGGTCRLLTTQNLGERDLLINAYLGIDNATRAGTQFKAPGQTGSTAMLLHGSRDISQYFMRGVASKNGVQLETYQVTTDGEIYGKNLLTSGPLESSSGGIKAASGNFIAGTGDYTYQFARTFRHSRAGADATTKFTLFSTQVISNFGDPEGFGVGGVADLLLKLDTDPVAGGFQGTYPINLPDGAIVTKIGIRYTSNAGVTADDVRFALISKQGNAAPLSMKTGAPNYFALTIDGTTKDDEFVLTESLANRTVNNDMFTAGRTWSLWVGHPAGGLGDYLILIHSLWVEYTMTTVAGA